MSEMDASELLTVRNARRWWFLLGGRLGSAGALRVRDDRVEWEPDDGESQYWPSPVRDGGPPVTAFTIDRAP